MDELTAEEKEAREEKGATMREAGGSELGVCDPFDIGLRSGWTGRMGVVARPPRKMRQREKFKLELGR